MSRGKTAARNLSVDEQRFADLLLASTTFAAAGSGSPDQDVFLEFSSAEFFDRWFKLTGTPLYFLFKKNLRVTNIQFAELLSLLQKLTVHKAGGQVDIQFTSHKELSAGLRELVSDFRLKDRTHARRIFRKLAENYHYLLERTVVVDPYYGSCSVFLPPELSLDLSRVCAESGYIHSCGYHIYVRNVNKANSADLFDALERHLDAHSTPEAPKTFFAVYTHEDFTKADIEERKEAVLIHGISDLKLYIDKFYMGKDRLVSIISTLENEPRVGKRLEIPPPGDYRIQHADNVNRPNTIWLLRDYSVGASIEEQGDTIYYICYDQRYKNENPFHIFDENKPAWIEHTTTPQTLVSAMINITRPGWREVTRLCDPFVGTGTTLLEALKFDRVEVMGRDISSLSAIICKDNLRFFASSPEQLKEIENEIRKSMVSRTSQPSPGTGRDDAFTFYMSIKDSWARFEASTGEFKMRNRDEARFAQFLATLSFHERIITYLRLRVIRRRTGAFLRGTLNWDEAYKEEAEQLLREIQNLSETRTKMLREKDGEIDIIQGRYSGYCTYGPTLLDERWSRQVRIETGKVERLPRNRYDVIIADPPYGFNTAEDVDALADLYCKMLPTLVRALRDGGQLVIALPERSYIGRQSPHFTHKEIVTQQIINAGTKTDLELMVRSVPEPTRLYRPPYYWRSEKALSRTVLHFRFRKVGAKKKNLATEHGQEKKIP